MSTTVADLLVRIEANTQQLRNEVRKGEGVINNFDKRVNRAALSSSSAFSRIGRSAQATIGILAGLGVSLGVAEIATGIAQVNAQFQDLQTGLKVATGSAEAADAAFARLRVFAKETPFQLTELTNAFIQLKNLGLDASIDSLRLYGDVASSFNGKTIKDFIEAIADAATGEFERLKEFGITARSEGEQVAFTFRGMTTTIGKNAREIEGYLQDLARVNFGGASIEKMDNLSGRFSNLKDAVDDLYVTIGESGGINVMAASIDLASDAVVGLTDSLDEVVTVIALVGAAAAGKFLGPMVANLGQAATAQAAYTAQVLRGTVVTVDSTKADVLRTAAEKASTLAALDRAKAELQKSAVIKGGTANEFARAAVLKQITILEGRAAAATAAHSAALAKAGVAAKAATVSMRALSGAMAFLGGPVGAAITVLASGMYLLSQRTDEAAEASRRYEDVMGRIKDLTQTANDKARERISTLKEDTKAVIAATEAELELLKVRLEAEKRANDVARDMPGFVEGLDVIGPAIKETEKAIQATEARLADLKKGLEDVSNVPVSTGTDDGSGGGSGGGSDSDKEAEKIRKVVDSLKFQREQLARLPREQAVYNAMQQAGISANHEMAASIRSAALAYYDAKEAIKQNTKAEEDAKNAKRDIDASIDALQLENTLLQVQGVEREKLRAILEAEATAREGGIALSDEQRQQIEDLIEANERLKTAEEQAAEAARDARQYARDFGNVIGTSFEDAVLEGEKLGDVLKSLEKDIARIILRMTVTKPLENAIGGILGDVLGDGAGGGITGAGSGKSGGIFGAIGSLFGFANGGIMTGSGPVPLRAYSNGGVASSPQLALFGEGRTPEAYVPLPDGRNIPVKMEGGGEPFTYSPMITIDARNSTMSPAEIRSIVKTAVDSSVAEVRSLQRRKGNARI